MRYLLICKNTKIIGLIIVLATIPAGLQVHRPPKRFREGLQEQHQERRERV